MSRANNFDYVSDGNEIGVVVVGVEDDRNIERIEVILGIDEKNIHLPAAAANVAHTNTQSAAIMGENNSSMLLRNRRDEGRRKDG